MPASTIERLESELCDLSVDQRHIRRRQRIEAILDNGYGSCILLNPGCATIVRDAWKHFSHQRYDLQAWVVMPNHVHVLIRERLGYPLPKVIESWKSFTAHAINALLDRSGPVWQADYYDRFIRDSGHFDRAVAYIHGNPVRAGLAATVGEWKWSSAVPEVTVLGSESIRQAAETAAPPGSKPQLEGDIDC